MMKRIKRVLDSVPKDGYIYLVEKITHHTGFFITNGHLLYIVLNFESLAHTSLSTDYLRLNTNVEIQSFKNNQMFPSGKYNILEFLPTESGYEENNLESFVSLCVSHAKFMEGRSFVKFFFSLSELFQAPKEQQYKNLVGFFGELSFLKYFCLTNAIDLSSNWHKGGSWDKYEITLENKNIEIKTTAAFDEEVTIKHTQLFNEDQNYLAVVCVEETNSGQSLNQLIASMMEDPNHFNNYNFVLNLERERRRVSPVDADNKRFTVKKIDVYNAREINPFGEIPDCVLHLTYKLDLTGEKSIPQGKLKIEFQI